MPMTERKGIAAGALLLLILWTLTFFMAFLFYVTRTETAVLGYEKKLTAHYAAESGAWMALSDIKEGKPETSWEGMAGNGAFTVRYEEKNGQGTVISKGKDRTSGVTRTIKIEITKEKGEGGTDMHLEKVGLYE